MPLKTAPWCLGLNYCLHGQHSGSECQFECNFRRQHCEKLGRVAVVESSVFGQLGLCFLLGKKHLAAYLSAWSEDRVQWNTVEMGYVHSLPLICMARKSRSLSTACGVIMVQISGAVEFQGRKKSASLTSFMETRLRGLD